MNAELINRIAVQLEYLYRLAPDMRFGQLVATVGMLGEDTSGRSLWDLEDDEFLAAAERFRNDLERRCEASNQQAQLA